jgi:hypothetical protein
MKEICKYSAALLMLLLAGTVSNFKAQGCLNPFTSVTVYNTLDCDIEVYIEVEQCGSTACGGSYCTAYGGARAVQCHSSNTFAGFPTYAGSCDDVDVIVTSVGGVNIPSGNNEGNPCAAPNICLPGGLPAADNVPSPFGSSCNANPACTHFEIKFYTAGSPDATIIP